MMESATSLFTLPMYASDERQDIRKIEEAASKALKRIHDIYTEIMAPGFSSSDMIENDILEYCKEAKTDSEQSHCSIVFSELCSKREQVPSRCRSCNKCDCSPIKTSLKDGREMDKYLEQLQKKCYNPKSYHLDSNTKLTATSPQPFSISVRNAERERAKECKISKLKEELNNKIEQELKVRIRSKPVPKNTYLPLYSEMVKQNEKRRVDRKEKCVQLSKVKVKPFSLSAYSKDDNPKAKSVSDLISGAPNNIFKAKPVPKNILSNKISEQLKNKEEIRKLLIAQRAEEILKQSSLPFSEKNICRSHSMINLNDFNKRNFAKKVKPKNMSAVTDRLYNKKCKEVMECWNNKVMQIDKLENNISAPKNNEFIASTERSKLLFPVDPFPFLYFPVRMSSAAMLRERQIRAEILARKQKIEQEKNIEEETAQRKKEIQRNILPRLKDLDPTIDSHKEIEEKVKSFRSSQINRKQEYEKELEKMMKRVSKQLLLMERQSKAQKINSHKRSCSDHSDSDKQSTSNSDDENSEETYSQNCDSSSV